MHDEETRSGSRGAAAVRFDAPLAGAPGGLIEGEEGREGGEQRCEGPPDSSFGPQAHERRHGSRTLALTDGRPDGGGGRWNGRTDGGRL